MISYDKITLYYVYLVIMNYSHESCVLNQQENSRNIKKRALSLIVYSNAGIIGSVRSLRQ